MELDAQFVTASDGVRLACYVTGDGPIDLIWSGYGPFSIDLLADEPGFLLLARRLARFSRTLWATMRGVGASGGALDDIYDDWSIFERDLTDVADAFDMNRPVLVGQGVGGPWTIQYAHEHPERVAALVLIDSYASYTRTSDYPIGLSADSIDKLATTAGDLWGSAAAVDLHSPSKSKDPGYKQRWARVERLGHSPDEHARTLRRSLLDDCRHLLPTLSVPTLVLHRQGDRFIHVDAGRWLAAHIPTATYVELPGDDHMFFVGDVDALADEIEDYLTGGHQGPEGDVETVTILFTDIVASTEQSARLGHRGWTALTADHDAAVRATLRRYRGHEVKTLGDGFLARFDATTRAVRAAAEIVQAAGAAGLEVRAGVHTGEVEVRPDDVVGLPVSIAKRVCDLAGAGEVFVTEVVRLQLAGSGIEVEGAGTHVLKGVPGEWPLLRVAVDADG